MLQVRDKTHLFPRFYNYIYNTTGGFMTKICADLLLTITNITSRNNTDKKIASGATVAVPVMNYATYLIRQHVYLWCRTSSCTKQIQLKHNNIPGTGSLQSTRDAPDTDFAGYPGNLKAVYRYRISGADRIPVPDLQPDFQLNIQMSRQIPIK
jgi:hypothetical protein